MHRVDILALPIAVTAWIAQPVTPVLAQQGGPMVVAHTAEVSPAGGGNLELELADGSRVTLELNDGDVQLDGATVAHYTPGGELDRAWRDLLGRAGEVSPAILVRALREWKTPALSGAEAAAKAAVTGAVIRLRAPALPPGVSAVMPVPLPAAPLPPDVALAQALRGPDAAASLSGIARAAEDGSLTLKDGTIHSGDYEVPEGATVDGSVLVLHGDADVQGHVKGSVVTVHGDLTAHSGARIDGDAIALRGEVSRHGAVIGGEIRSGLLQNDPDANPNPDFESQFEPPSAARSTLGVMWANTASLVGALVALGCIGFGLVFFMPRELEIVADTVSQSFTRSFFAGLLATPLIAPALATLVVALALTIVGLLVIPVAVPAFVIALVLAVLGGYLAAARSVGEFIARRRSADAAWATPAQPYRYLVVGLVAMAALWVPAALLGWLPIAGTIFLWTAILFTWIVATAGFGAVILSRAGIKGTFVRRFSPELADESRWTGSYSLTARRAAERKSRA